MSVVNQTQPKIALAFGVHYAWIMVIVAVGMRLTSSATRSASSVLVPVLADPNGLGWSYGAIGAAFSLQWIFSGVFGPPAGWLGDRFGARPTMVVGALLFIGAMMLTGTMTELWQFYLYFGVLLSAAMAVFGVPLMVGVSLWFKKRLGVGMGALQASQGVGPFVSVPLILWLLNDFGLQWAFWGPGIAGGILLLLMVRLFHSEPADLNMKPLGAEPDEPVQRIRRKGKESKAQVSTFLRHAQRTGAFWNLIGIHFWGCAGHAIVLVFMIAIAEEQGLSKGVAAGTFMVMSLASTGTRFAVPVIADRIGSKGVMAVCFFLQALPVLILFVAQDVWQFYLFAVLFGIGFGGEMSAFPIINRQYYGHTAPIGVTYGWQMLGAGIGMAAGAGLGGLAWDLSGTYHWTVALSFILSMIGAISILILPATSKLLTPHWEDDLKKETSPG